MQRKKPLLNKHTKWFCYLRITVHYPSTDDRGDGNGLIGDDDSTVQ